MKRILSIFLVSAILIMSGCSAKNQEVQSESGRESEAVSSETEQNEQEETQKEKAVGFVLPEGFSMHESQILDNENRVIAEISLQKFSDENSFEQCDVLYNDCLEQKDLTLGGYDAKYYHLQKEVESEGVTAKENTLVYCIHMGTELATVEYYPAMGIGIGSQREDFEKILNTIYFEDQA